MIMKYQTYNASEATEKDLLIVHDQSYIDSLKVIILQQVIVFYTNKCYQILVIKLAIEIIYNFQVCIFV